MAIFSPALEKRYGHWSIFSYNFNFGVDYNPWAFALCRFEPMVVSLTYCLQFLYAIPGLQIRGFIVSHPESPVRSH